MGLKIEVNGCERALAWENEGIERLISKAIKDVVRSSGIKCKKYTAKCRKILVVLKYALLVAGKPVCAIGCPSSGPSPAKNRNKSTASLISLNAGN